MKQKHWIDCPVCGAKGTMKYKVLKGEKITPLGYKTIEIGALSGDFCTACGEGFYDIESLKIRKSKIAEGKAMQDAERTKVSELVTLAWVASKAKVSKQRVSKMINEGKIPYVIVAGVDRYPVKQPDSFYEGLRKREEETTAKVHHTHK